MNRDYFIDTHLRVLKFLKLLLFQCSVLFQKVVKGSLYFYFGVLLILRQLWQPCNIYSEVLSFDQKLLCCVDLSSQHTFHNQYEKHNYDNLKRVE
jgi:hypothetical protein